MNAKKPNIYDVAALAEVSHQTVSRVLNNQPNIRPATRERVEAAIVDDPPQKDVDGLLGMSYLRRFSFRIDQEKRKLYLSAFR